MRIRTTDNADPHPIFPTASRGSQRTSTSRRGVKNLNNVSYRRHTVMARSIHRIHAIIRLCGATGNEQCGARAMSMYQLCLPVQADARRIL